MIKNLRNALPGIGIGSISVGLPKEAVSGKVPAWLIWGSVVGLSAGKLWVSYRNKKRECETKERIAKFNARTSKVAQNNHHGKSDPCTTTSDVTSCPDDDIPEWADGGAVEDKKVDSILIGQSGGLVLVKGREGSGKTTLVNQLLVEACEGRSSNLFPNMEETIGPEWSVFFYESEAMPKFHTNFGKKHQELADRFKTLINNFRFHDVESALRHIRKSVMRISGNCAVALDNVTDMFPDITNADINRFITGLKAIRRDMNAQGREITFIVVTHANRVTEEASGSSLWQNLFEVVISIQEDKSKHKGDSNYKILYIEKSRFGAQTSTPIHRDTTQYMHFENYSEDEMESTIVDDKLPSEKSVERRPITKDVEDLFASMHIPNKYGYLQIFNDYKHLYIMKSKHDVRNAIERSKKRAGKAA